MKILLKILLGFLFTISFYSKANDPETLKKAWEALHQNEREYAFKLFNLAKENPKISWEANLGLAMIYWGKNNNEQAFKHIEQFYYSSENPAPYLYSLWVTGMISEGLTSSSGKYNFDFLNKLLADKRLNGTMKAMIHERIGGEYERSMNTKQAIEEFSKIGAIENWQILGTFENSSASGFNKDFGALMHPEPTMVFKNKLNREIKWFNPPIERTDKWIDFTYNVPAGNSIMYAQSFLESPINQDVIIRSGCSGSMKIWVNDKLITNEIVERNCDLDLFNQTIKLQKGINRILVQIGESEAGRANFLIRITDKEGNNISGLKSSYKYQLYSKATDYESKTIAFFPEEFFEKKIAENPNEVLNYILLAHTYTRNDKIYEAKKILKKARELAPVSTLLSEAILDANNRDDNTTEINREESFIKTKDSESFLALQLLYIENFKNEKYDDADVILNKMIANYGNSRYTDFEILSILFKQQKREEGLKWAQSLYEKYPNNYQAVENAYLIEKNINKNTEGAESIFLNFLENNFNDKVYGELSRSYFEKGEKDNAINKYKERIEAYPFRTGYYIDLADQYYSMNDYPNALQYVKKALEMAPYIGLYWERLGQIQNEMNQKVESIQSYKKAVSYEPTLFAAQKRLRQLENKKDLFENFKVINADSIYKKSTSEDKNYPNDNSLILLNETQRVVYPEGATEERNEMLIKVLKQEGIEDWKEYVIYYLEKSQKLLIEKAEVYKTNGSILNAEINANQLVFTGLEIGDAIHIVYRLENNSTGMLSEHFKDQVLFSLGIPINHISYSLLIPENIDFKFTTLNTTIKPQIKLIDNFKLYNWEIKNQKSFEVELLMPPLTDVVPKLEVSTIPGWKFVANWYKDLALTKSKSDFEVQEAVRDLFKNKPKNLSELTKANTIYSYIIANINYSSIPFMQSNFIPQKASRTLSTKLGDCKDLSTLFVAMCREVGIKANLVLVSTRDNGENDMLLPSIDFNHCIATITIDSKIYYIELTDPKNSFGTLSSNLLRSNALKIPSEGDDFEPELFKINTENRIKNTVFRNTNIHFSQKDLIVAESIINTGSLAADYRRIFEPLSDEERLSTYTKLLTNVNSSSIKVNTLKFNDLDEVVDSVSINSNYLMKNFISEVAGMKIFQLPWAEKFTSPEIVNSETRIYPFLSWNLMEAEAMSETLNLTLPTGKKLAEIPKPISLNSDFAEYKINFEIKGDKIKATRYFKIKKDIIEAKDYPKFREFFNRVIEADTKQIAFK